MQNCTQILIDIFAVLIFLLMLVCIVFLAKKGLLQDQSTAEKKPYSFSRVQLAWWTVIIIGSFLYIFSIDPCKYVNQEINQYTVEAKNILMKDLLSNTALILLGISAGTLGVGRIIDIGQENKDSERHQNQNSDGFLTDILSDENGISIHRFQSVIFNIIFGLIFIFLVLNSKKMPDFSEIQLTLMGISSGTYIGLKATENTTKPEVKG
ncbi:MAG: hypothetical protein NT007_13965 [Candidatus Kapabacteria bacterium]|nr:hypothetical protein [Candidatus Kapabacteria bacterium]